jgi:hypothetical protein
MSLLIDELKKRGITPKSVDTPLKWGHVADFVCSNGHVFTSKVSNIVRSGREIKQNMGCAQCEAAAKKELSMALAKEKLTPGHQIKETFTHTSEGGVKSLRYRVMCSNGHEYVKVSYTMGEGCPTCNQKLLTGQERVRAIFEQHFGKKFERIRPTWLKNPNTSVNLELDGYCEELKLAFEFHGKQHFDNNTEFGGELELQQARDAMKRKLCEKHGVRLVEIHQPPRYEMGLFYQSVRDQCAESFGIFLKPLTNEERGEIMTTVHGKAGNDARTVDFKKYVEGRGYKLLSRLIPSLEDMAEFECKDGHQFKMTPTNFKQFYQDSYKHMGDERFPCEKCKLEKSPNARKSWSLEDCNDIAKKNGWKLLSDTYKGQNEMMVWECENGHQATRSAKSFIRAMDNGTGCVRCKSLAKDAVVVAKPVNEFKVKAMEIFNGQDERAKIELASSPELKRHPELVGVALKDPSQTVKVLYLCLSGVTYTHEMLSSVLESEDPTLRALALKTVRANLTTMLPSPEELERGLNSRFSDVSELFKKAEPGWKAILESRQLMEQLERNKKEGLELLKKVALD